jgi:hypothetical protein
MLLPLGGLHRRFHALHLAGRYNDIRGDDYANVRDNRRRRRIDVSLTRMAALLGQPSVSRAPAGR